MSELYHYGVKGMKWGVRRAQKKELKSINKEYRSLEKSLSRIDSGSISRLSTKKSLSEKSSRMQSLAKRANELSDGRKLIGQDSIVEKYKTKGYKDAEAEYLASRAIKNTSRIFKQGVGSLAVHAYGKRKVSQYMQSGNIGMGLYADMGRKVVSTSLLAAAAMTGAKSLRDERRRNASMNIRQQVDD